MLYKDDLCLLSPCAIALQQWLNGSHVCHRYQGRPQDLGGGGAKNFFFQIWEFACREAMRIARGVRGHAPPRKFFKTVQFGAF